MRKSCVLAQLLKLFALNSGDVSLHGSFLAKKWTHYLSRTGQSFDSQYGGNPKYAPSPSSSSKCRGHWPTSYFKRTCPPFRPSVVLCSDVLRVYRVAMSLELYLLSSWNMVLKVSFCIFVLPVKLNIFHSERMSALRFWPRIMCASTGCTFRNSQNLSVVF